MPRLPITEKHIKQILENRISMIESIHRRIEYLNKDASQTSDIIEAVSLKSKALSDMPRGGSGHKDLFIEYEKYQILLDKRYQEYATGIHQLIQQEERIERIWICFNAIDTEAYNILHRLYVKKELYSAVESDTKLAHAAFEKKRKRAIQDIIRLYTSELNNDFIFKQAEDIRNKPLNTSKDKHIKNEQLSLLDILTEEAGDNDLAQ